jgi:ATP-binding cassette subfamily B (MDR/TAP) protein 1
MSDEKSDPAAAAAALSSSSSSPYTHDTRPHIPSDAIEMTDQASADTIVRAQTDSLSNDHDANNAPEVTAEEALTQLSTQEQEILKKQVETPEGKYGFKDLYRYATGLDIAIILVSSVCAAASGASLPIMAILFGGTQGVFQSYLAFQTITLDEFRSQMAEFVLYFVYLAIGTFAATYISTVGFIYTGEHISGKIRQKYLESCLRQNIGFFDKLGIGEVTVKITTDTTQIQDGVSEKVGLLVSSIATVITGYAIGFAKSWKLTLILSSTLFALLISSAVGTGFIIKYVVPMGISAGKAGGVADEVLGSIRIATAFGNQNRLIGNYDSHLAVSQEWGFKLKSSVSIMTAVSLSLLYLNYGLGFWQGSIFMAQGNLDVENMIITIMAVMMGSFTVGTIGPYIQVFLEAIATSGRLYNVIDRNTPLDATSTEGETLPKVTGHLRLESVKHIYPSRPDVTVMDEVTLDVPPGKITAIVGASGSGKSTIVGLIQRFYSPVNGRILLDGVDISTINLRWLRQQMAVVNQEPVLFAVSIFDNIRYGLLGTEWEDSTEEKQRELVTEAAKMANAHEFISQLPQGYDTNVGQRGFLLSGGQKQRIAIARAVVSNPKSKCRSYSPMKSAAYSHHSHPWHN